MMGSGDAIGFGAQCTGDGLAMHFVAAFCGLADWIGDRGENALSNSSCFAPCVYGSEYREELTPIFSSNQSRLRFMASSRSFGSWIAWWARG
jgi:hypothetical protein